MLSEVNAREFFPQDVLDVAVRDHVAILRLKLELVSEIFWHILSVLQAKVLIRRNFLMNALPSLGSSHLSRFRHSTNVGNLHVDTEKGLHAGLVAFAEESGAGKGHLWAAER